MEIEKITPKGPGSISQVSSEKSSLQREGDKVKALSNMTMVSMHNVGELDKLHGSNTSKIIAVIMEA